MGNKKPPKNTKAVKLLASQVEFLEELKMRLGVDYCYQAFEYMLKVVEIVETFMNKTGAKTLREFITLLDDCLPTSESYKLRLRFKALNTFQEELRRAGVDEDDLQKIVEYVANIFNGKK